MRFHPARILVDGDLDNTPLHNQNFPVKLVCILFNLYRKQRQTSGRVGENQPLSSLFPRPWTKTWNIPLPRGRKTSRSNEACLSERFRALREKTRI